MVKFLTALSQNPDVEDAMRDVNQYIMFNDSSVVSDSLKVNCANAEIQAYFELIQTLNMNYTLNHMYPIVSGGKFSKLKTIIKKIIRKPIAWYAKALCQQQIDINANIVRSLNGMTHVMQTIMIENESLKKQIKELQKTNTNCMKENEDVN